MWKMPSKSDKLLPSEIKELVDVLEKTLYSYVDNAVDGKHAATILLEAGLIDERAVRNISIIKDLQTSTSRIKLAIYVGQTPDISL